MTEIIWVKGQSEFDFDSLLKLTSQRFVDAITDFIKQEYVIAVKFFKYDAIDDVDVIIVNDGSVRVFTFTKYNDSYETTMMKTDDLSWALSYSN